MPKYVIVFLALLSSFFGIFSASQNITTAAYVKNTQYTEYLTSATYDAAKKMKDGSNGEAVMPQKSDREKVVNTFFNSLALNFGYDTDEDMEKLHTYVPVLVLVDNDGYYLCYNNNHKKDNVNYLQSVITDINTWSAETKDQTMLVRYYLGNKVDVTFLKAGTYGGKTYNVGDFISGTYDEIYKKIDNGSNPNDLTSLGFNNASTFIKKRNELIIPDIQSKVEYYINHHNEVVSAIDTSYVFEMPMTSQDDWVRVLENPTCIAFLQGMQLSNSKKYLNIYALGGGEVRKTDTVSYYNVDETTHVKRYYEAGADPNQGQGQAGYLANDAAAAKEGAEVQYKDDVNDPSKANMYHKTVEHHHWGDPQKGTGCYTKPVYKTNDEGSKLHVHSYPVYKSGSETLTLTRDKVLADPALKSLFTRNDKQLNTIPATIQYSGKTWTVDPTSAANSCYQQVNRHKHDELCNIYVYHHHDTTGTTYIDPNTGYAQTKGGCYTAPVYDQTGQNIIGYTPACGYWDTNHLTKEEKAYEVYFWDNDHNRSEAINALKNSDDYKYGTRLTKQTLIEAELKKQGGAYNKAWDVAQAKLSNAIVNGKAWNQLTSEERKQRLTDYIASMRAFVIQHETQGTTPACGYEAGVPESYSLTCGLQEGEVVDSSTSQVIDHYELGCGLNDGDLITEDEAKTKNQH
jgi:hypothetical protein